MMRPQGSEDDVAKFVVAPYMRLHEWVARDKGYFEHEGLVCEFSDQLTCADRDPRQSCPAGGVEV
jgi:hypothetical protein